MKRGLVFALVILGTITFMMHDAMAKGPKGPKGPKPPKFNAVSRLAHAGDVTGVLSCNGTLAAGVFVYIPGTSFVAVTDDAGKFTLYNVPSNEGGEPYLLRADADLDPTTPAEDLIPGGFTVGPKVVTDLLDLSAITCPAPQPQ